jgi:hypothetical protein
MSGQLRRGRPPTFTTEQREQFAGLIWVYGARGTLEVSTIPISLPTLLKIAREFQIPLKHGRRQRRAA